MTVTVDDFQSRHRLGVQTVETLITSERLPFPDNRIMITTKRYQIYLWNDMRCINTSFWRLSSPEYAMWSITGLGKHAMGWFKAEIGELSPSWNAVVFFSLFWIHFGTESLNIYHIIFIWRNLQSIVSNKCLETSVRKIFLLTYHTNFKVPFENIRDWKTSKIHVRCCTLSGIDCYSL